MPSTLAVAEGLLEAGAPQLATDGVALPEALADFWTYLAPENAL
jgi:hypothetical protein